MPQHEPLNLAGRLTDFVGGHWHGGCLVHSGEIVIAMDRKVSMRWSKVP
jgi:hypothetical protein